MTGDKKPRPPMVPAPRQTEVLRPQPAEGIPDVQAHWTHSPETLPDEQRAHTMASNTMPAPPPALEPKPGDVIAGRYRIDGLLGSGGMGKVYRGQHLSLKMPIAVKVLHGYIAAKDEAGRRFYREARAATLLNHPNVVHVLDFGVHEGLLFLVMELIDGRSLADFIDELSTPPALADVGEILSQLTRALEAAHSLGIVHRDLKPDNVILGTDATGARVVKVVDFGLAHLDEPEDEGPTLTKADAVAGTPDYMSPEQCRSLKVGPSTDLYACGCILTELLQLRPPFSGASAIDVISQHMFVPPPPLGRPEGSEAIPPLLERLRLELLAKQPHDRPASAEEVRRRLEEALDPEAHAARLPARKGDVPLGSREARVPEWTAAGSAEQPAPRSERRVCVLRVVDDGGGVTSTCMTGLAAQGVIAESVASVAAVDPQAALVVLDVGSEHQRAETLLAELGDARPVVVCAANVGAAQVQSFIEAGAADVQRYPVSVDVLARKLSRFLRKL